MNFEVRRAVVTKAPLRVHFLLTFFWGGGGEGQEALEGSIESQQKFDFFSYESTPYLVVIVMMIVFINKVFFPLSKFSL